MLRFENIFSDVRFCKVFVSALYAEKKQKNWQMISERRSATLIARI